MTPICVKGKKISSFLIQTDQVTYPMEDTEYLKIIPTWREGYVLLEKVKNNQYKLLKFLFTNNENNS